MPIINSISNRHKKNIEIIADGWVKVLKKYAKMSNHEDSIHWHNERTNIGALSAAVWLNKGVSLEEYSSSKTTDQTHGRVDLYLHLGDFKAVCEAKMYSISISKQAKLQTAIDRINESMDAAKNDCENTFHGGNDYNCLAVSFIMTYQKGEVNESIVADIEKHFEEISENRKICVSKYETKEDLVSSHEEICNIAYIVIEYMNLKNK